MLALSVAARPSPNIFFFIDTHVPFFAFRQLLVPCSLRCARGGGGVKQRPCDPPIEEGGRPNTPPRDAPRPRQESLLALPDGHRPRGHPGPAPQQRWEEGWLCLAWGWLGVCGYKLGTPSCVGTAAEIDQCAAVHPLVVARFRGEGFFFVHQSGHFRYVNRCTFSVQPFRPLSCPACPWVLLR